MFLSTAFGSPWSVLKSNANSMNAGPHQDKAPVAKVRLVKAKVAKTYDLLCARYDKS